MTSLLSTGLLAKKFSYLTALALTHTKLLMCVCLKSMRHSQSSENVFVVWYNRLGKKKAIIAVARKLLRYIYSLLSTGELYNRQLDIADTEKNKALKLESAKKRISKLEGKNKKPAAAADSQDSNTGSTEKNDITSDAPDKKRKRGQKSPISNPVDNVASELPNKKRKSKKNLAPG